MTVTPEQVRHLLAEDYARKARAGQDPVGLFEFAIEEGWLGGVAVGVEIAHERGDGVAVARLRAIVAAQTRPVPIAATSAGAAPAASSEALATLDLVQSTLEATRRERDAAEAEVAALRARAAPQDVEGLVGALYHSAYDSGVADACPTTGPETMTKRDREAAAARAALLSAFAALREERDAPPWAEKVTSLTRANEQLLARAEAAEAAAQREGERAERAEKERDEALRRADHCSMDIGAYMVARARVLSAFRGGPTVSSRGTRPPRSTRLLDKADIAWPDEPPCETRDVRVHHAEALAIAAESSERALREALNAGRWAAAWVRELNILGSGPTERTVERRNRGWWHRASRRSRRARDRDLRARAALASPSPDVTAPEPCLCSRATGAPRAELAHHTPDHCGALAFASGDKNWPVCGVCWRPIPAPPPSRPAANP